MKMIDIIVNAGHFGDWEWENARSMWNIWIQNKITKNFQTAAAQNADEICIRFFSKKDAVLFSLLRPVYISYSDVEIFIPTVKTSIDVK